MVNNKVHTQDILKGIGAGLCLLDRNFRIVWINKFQSEWFGTPQDICGKYCYRTFQHRNCICPKCPTYKVFKTGNIHKANQTGFTKDGQKHYYQLTVSPIKDNHNRVMFALELVQDITKNTKTQRHNLNIIRKLKHAHRHLSSVNIRLYRNLQRIKEIARNFSGFNRLLKEKYRRQKNRVMVLKEELQDIFKVNRTISSGIDLKKISSLIIRLTCELVHTDACLLYLLDENKKILTVNAGYGINEHFIKKMPALKVGEGICGRVVKAKKPLAIYDTDKISLNAQKELISNEGFESLISVPVIFQDTVLGAITTYSKKPRHFFKEEIEILRIFASQVAIAIRESRYYEDIHTNYFNTIHTLVLTIEARDPYTRGHTERVTKYALEVAHFIKMPRREREVLRYAGEVHDVGKISTPDFILNKPGPLNPTEMATVELHPVKGAEMLEPLEFLRPALPIVRHHHERYDGRGYPDGLKEEKIPLMSRILACADAFDAMTSERPYRKRKLSIEEALEEIKKNAGSQFDPHIASLFIKVIRAQNLLKIKALQ